ncbi:MAG TPA: hypothetical protein VGA73_04795, partial [Candidatus Binatia bacterium]
GEKPAGDEVPVDYRKPFKIPADGVHPLAKFTMTEVDGQDFMAWETQGPIADRTRERLATSDHGVVMFRQMLMREIERMKANQDPMNVQRDPAHPIIDTAMEASLRAEKAGSVTYHMPRND